MDFLLNTPNEPPVMANGAINLQDWKHAGSNQAVAHYPVKLPSGTVIQVSTTPEAPTAQMMELSDEDLHFAAAQNWFPTINAVMFLRGLIHDVDAIAPMLSFGSFFAEFSVQIKKLIETNLKNKATADEWVEYYAGELASFPIFSTIFNTLTDKNKQAIGKSYFDQFVDIRYLDQKQLDALTLDDKVKVLRTTITNSPGNEGRLATAINLFGPDDIIPHEDAATILGLLRSSTDLGRLIGCSGFNRDYTNSYNLVAVWIQHCINEKIGTNQSVWYQEITNLELTHNFALAGEYIKNLRGTPIGLNQMATQVGSVSGGFRSAYSNNQPMGL